jgi:outer membrane murein-binding lipoprotein Lpp/phage head maturation protease
MSEPRSVCFALLASPEADVQKNDDGAPLPLGFRGVAYSGGVVPNFGWHGDMAIDLASVQLPARDVPVLLNHDPNQIVGRATLRSDGTQLVLENGKFSAVTDEGKRVQSLMGEGHPWSFSVGINARPRTADRSKPETLNGRKLAIDTVATQARVLEVSFVPAGADPNAFAAQLSARLGMPSPQKGDESMTPEQSAARITELEGQVRTLTGQVATLTTERDAARTQLAAQTRKAREDQLDALFKADELTAEQRAAYLDMTEAQFAAVTAHLSTRRADPALFQQQATAGRSAEGAPAAAAYQAPAGFAVDTERANLHAKALAYQRQNPNTDYLAAITAVQGA